MTIEFTKIAEGENLENILKLWKDACATEELYSLQRGEKNNNFLQGYETQFKTEYSSTNPFIRKTTHKTYSDFTKRNYPIVSNTHFSQTKGNNPHQSNIRETNLFQTKGNNPHQNNMGNLRKGKNQNNMRNLKSIWIRTEN